MAGKQIKKLIPELIGDWLTENGYELYNVEYIKEAGSWILRVYIDKIGTGTNTATDTGANQAGGPVEEFVSTDDCEKVSRYLSEKLDETDPIQQNYYLEVSSPGLDRELTTPAHFERFTGSLVDIKLYSPLDGSKEWTGTLQGLQEDCVVIEDEKGETLRFPREKVAIVRLAVVF